MGYEHEYGRIIKDEGVGNIVPCLWRTGILRRPYPNQVEEHWEHALQIAQNKSEALLIIRTVGIQNSGNQLQVKPIRLLNNEETSLVRPYHTDNFWKCTLKYLQDAHKNPAVQKYPMLAWITPTYQAIKDAYEMNQYSVILEGKECTLLRDVTEHNHIVSLAEKLRGNY